MNREAVDKELERIKQKKLREMMKGKSSRGGPALNRPVDVNDTTFNGIIQKNPLVVIDCWAAWCGPCRIVGPIIEELARDYAGKILFGKLNVDENKEVAIMYQIMSIPTMLVFRNGKMVDRIVGAMPRQMLESRITRHL